MIVVPVRSLPLVKALLFLLLLRLLALVLLADEALRVLLVHSRHNLPADLRLWFLD